MRARYKGQTAGDENRLASDSFAERLADNEVVEGPEVKKMRRLYTSGDWPALNRFTDELKASGWSQTRIQSMLTRAMANTRMPKR